ncbi:11751_t:CDS:2 [Ambispora leptoticha]|uniref:11751_t:CDS:1 n=1 Tax=Ambispora leptoticha TaxID=144679 RepID=A0A9N9FJP1_9GLOM|nr:11751_t:CDS:2 [Ambispora leptoticha]
MSNSEKKQVNSQQQEEHHFLNEESLNEDSSNAKPTTSKDITTNASPEEKSSTSKKSKKKKKPKASTSNNQNNMNNNMTKDELDEIVEGILNEPNPSNVSSNNSNTTLQTCPIKNCKQRLTLTSITCQFCNMRYCLAHRLPESHSEKCAEKTRQSAHSSFRNDSIRLITEERRNPGIINTKGFNAEKSKEELRKRYKEKLERTKQQERGGGRGKG